MIRPDPFPGRSAGGGLPHPRGRDYRRGTILGFTVAEVFMLLGFALVLLLLFAETVERQRTAEAVRFAGAFTAEERAILEQAGKEGWVGRIAALNAQGEDVRATLELAGRLPGADIAALLDRAKAAPASDLAQALEMAGNGEIRKLSDLRAAVEKGARLVEEQDLLVLVDALKRLPAARREELLSLVSVSGDEDVAAWAREIARLVAEGHAPDDIARALALLATLSPGEEAEIDALRERIRTRIARADAAAEALAADIRARAGERIAAIGGTIDPATGTVTLPDVALFDQGSAVIRPELTGFLKDFCPAWLELLSGFGAGLDRILIEGHASSEWNDATPLGAFLNNMRLSQARASAVVDRCLSLVEGRPFAEFAQSHLVAVGHSSAKPVLTEGREDRERSRRVVFRVEFDREGLIGDIAADLEPVARAP